MRNGRAVDLGGYWLLVFAVAVVGILGIVDHQALANMTIEVPEIDTTSMGTYAGTILTALAGIWLVRKFIKVTNRS